jgi:Chaperone of endosialidase/YadA head domain repeat (2 copies)
MFGGFGSASKDRNIPGTMTSLCLIGGVDCLPGLTPDLKVLGGARIKKTLCVRGNTELKDVLMDGDAIICGNLLVKENLTVYEKTVTGELGVLENTIMFGNLEVLGKTTLNELCVTGNSLVSGDITFTGNVYGIDVGGGGVESWSGGTTGLTPSTPTTGNVVLAGTLNTSNGGTGLSVIGTSDQILGVNGAGTGLEYKDDLNLTGGATFEGNVVAGNADILGKLTVKDLCTTDITRFGDDITVEGDIIVQGNIMAPFINIQGNCILTNDGLAKVCVYDGDVVEIDGDVTLNDTVTINSTLRTIGNVQFDQNLNVDGKLTAGELCVTNNIDIDGNGDIGGDLTVVGNTTTGNADVLGKLTTNDLCVTNDGDITGNLNVGNTTTTYDLCVTNDAIFKGNVTISGNLSAGVSSFSTGTTGLTPSSPTIGDVVLDGTLNTSSGGTGLSTIGASNQILGVNMAGTGLEYKDVIDLTGGATFGGNVEAGNVNVGEKLTAGDLCVTNDGDITGNLNVGEKLTAGELCVTNDGDITGNLNVGNTTTTYDLCVTNDAFFKGNVTISGNLSAGVSSWSAGTTGLTPSSPTIGDVVLSGTLNETNGGTGQTTYTTGDILYASASNTLSKLSVGSPGEVLTLSGGVPTWDTPMSGWVGTATSNLDMDCFEVSNVGHLYVGNLHGKSPIDVWDNLNMLDTGAGGKITFEGGVEIGNSTTTSEVNGISIGKGSSASYSSVTIGYNSGGTGNSSVSLGSSITSSGLNSVAIGRSINSSASDSIALGRGAFVVSSASYAISIGTFSAARSTNAIFLGHNSKEFTAGNDNSIGIGNSLNIGLSGYSSGIDCIAIGNNVDMGRNVTKSIAIGSNAVIRPFASGSAQNCVAIGPNVYIDTATSGTNDNVIAIGNGATASNGSDGGIAIGYSSIVSSTNGIALGQGVTANQTGGFFVRHRGPSGYTVNPAGFIAGTNELVEITSGGGEWVGNAATDLDMNCFEVSNVNALHVSNIYPSDECGDATKVTINGNVDIDGILTVDELCVTGNIAINYIIPKTLNGNITIDGNTIIEGRLCVEEDATFKSKVNINDRLAGNTVQEFWYVNTPGLNPVGPRQLVTYNVSTDTTNVIGSINVEEISFHDDVLYGLDNTGNVYSIDQSTAVETLEYQFEGQRLDGSAGLNGFAISPSGKFYGLFSSSPRLYLLDPDTNITTDLGPLGIDGDIANSVFGGACFFKNDLYTVLAYSPSTTYITRVNLSNPAYSDIVVETTGSNKIQYNLFTLEIDNEYRLYGTDLFIDPIVGEVDLITGNTINIDPMGILSIYTWSATSRSQYTPVLCLDGDVDLSDNDIYNVKHIEGNTINFVDGQITRKLTTNDICAYGNVEMNCNDIRNVGHLYVGNIHGKSPIDVWDDFNILNGNLITFEQGVLIGSNVTAGISSGVAVGKGATASGTYSTAIGSGPGAFLGAQATYTNSIAIGRQSYSTGPGTVSIGVSCISTGQQGIGMGVGAQARQNNSIAIGTSANCPTGGANNLGIAIGFQANSQGNQGIAIGYMANTTSPQGIAIGESASNGAFFGVAIGRDAVTTGQSSVAIGRQSKAGGNFTISIGYNSLYSSTGNYNIAIGRNTLSSLTTGIRNVSIGENGGNTVTTGSFNTVIGSRSDVTGIAASGQTAIGHEAVCQADNSVAIGHYAGTGTVGIGSFHTVLLNIGMNVAVHQNATTGELTRATSSIRYKENVKPLDSAINKIFDMNPVTFNYKPEHSTDKESHLGFIAEEMNEIYPEAVYKDSEGNPEGIHYETLTSVLIKALQEAVQNIKSLEQRVSSLEGNE